MLRYLSEKLVAKLLATKLSYSMVRIILLDNYFCGIFKLGAIPVEGESLHKAVL